MSQAVWNDDFNTDFEKDGLSCALFCRLLKTLSSTQGCREIVFICVWKRLALAAKVKHKNEWIKPHKKYRYRE